MVHQRSPHNTFWHPGGSAIALYYGTVPVARMAADVDMLARCLKLGEFLRVYSTREEAATALSALCATKGYRLRQISLREDDSPEGPVWRQSGHFVFDIHSLASDA